MAVLKHIFKNDTWCQCCGYDFITDANQPCQLALRTRFLAMFKYKIIRPDCPEGKIGKPLMTRWSLLGNTNSGRYALYLHLFHRSDRDDFHDHPWAFITFLFHRGYWEHTPTEDLSGCMTGGDKRIWHPRFSILYRPAVFRHYVEVTEPTWTLVFRFPKVRSWGFWIKGKFTPWREAEDLKSRAICEDIK